VQAEIPDRPAKLEDGVNQRADVVRDHEQENFVRLRLESLAPQGVREDALHH
jgi:hypothetical protein